jgi:hypothetical protein
VNRWLRGDIRIRALKLFLADDQPSDTEQEAERKTADTPAQQYPISGRL